MSSASDKVTFSVNEFNTIQQELVNLKQSKYELTEQNKKLTAEVNRLKQTEKEYQKAQNVINKSKEKGALQKVTSEVESLQRTIEMMNTEHREQSEALRNNVQLMLQKNREMSEDKDRVEAERARLESRIIDMKKQEMLQNEFRKLVQQVLSNHDDLMKQIFSSEDGSPSKSEEGNSDNNSSDATNGSTGATSVSQSSPSNNHTADQDLLNKISRLESEFEEQKKKHEKEIYNLEQQIEVWRERNKKRLEIEQHLTEANDTIEKLKGQLTDQQQLVNQMLDEREKANKDYQEVLKRITAQQEERANLMADNDSLNQRLQSLQKQLTSTNQMRDKLRKDNVDLSKKISDLEKSEESLKNTLEHFKQYKEKLESLSENFDTLQQNHKSSLAQLAASHQENSRLKDTCKELDIIRQKLEQADKKIMRLTQSNNDNTKEVRKLTGVNQAYKQRIEETSKTLIHHFVESTIAAWSTKILMENHEELSQQAARVPELLARLEKAESEVSQLQLKVKDTKTEYLLELKKNKNLVKELRSQLQSMQQQQQHQNTLDRPSPRRVGSFQELPSPSGMDSPRGRRQLSATQFTSHHRTNSGSSTGSPVSSDFVSPFASSAVQQQNQVMEQLQKDNNALLTKVGELQQTKWNLTERVRHLEESVMLLQEDLEKKQTIIQHYVERERTGRIAPEQERWAQNLKRKQEQKTGVPQSSAGINPDAYKHMQQVMQETLLHNIQLQKDIRTLGAEIARLQEKIEHIKSQQNVPPS